LTFAAVVCIIHTVKSADLIKLLVSNGWKVVRVRGSHHQFSHPDKPGNVVTVPHPRKDLGVGLVHMIKKQAGVD
jgi:predicted RNA binding protein YcfA (HicA-like mRNA interferase family)